MTFLKKYHLPLFFVAWTLINFYQAWNTVLFNDEAYYWVYSRFLAWGYFDHPPMIAILIKAGYYLFHNEFGVRFFIALLNTLTLVIIYKLLPKKNDGLFYTIVCSIGVIQFGGFIAVPDIPLVFFVSLFFLVYKNFTRNSSVQNSVLLGVVMACMLYSKYHGVLIILFTLISNIKLLTRPKAYLALSICIILFIPHLYWQYTHGFPSVQYQLFERNKSAYRPSYTLGYISDQLLLAGPLMGWLFLWCSYKYKVTDIFEKALKFSLFGMYIFFLITSFKSRVEANWTIPAMVPLIILSHQYLLDKSKWKRILIYTVPVSLALVFAVRVFIISSGADTFGINMNEFHLDKKWANKINTISRHLPIVFFNSYQKAAKYWFYSGIPAFSQNGPDYRRNNYNFWPIEKSLQGKEVYVINSGDPAFFIDSVETDVGIMRGRKIDSFYSYSSLQFKVVSKFLFNERKTLAGEIIIKDAKNTLDNEDIGAGKISIYIYKKREFIGSYVMNIKNKSGVDGVIFLATLIPVILPKGNYTGKLAMSSSLANYPTLNSNVINIIVK